MKVLNNTMPVSVTQKRYFRFSIMCCFSFRKLLIPRKKIITEAVDHRKNANVIGGIWSWTPRAIMKLPAQMMQVRIASAKPIYTVLFWEE
jgi:hypothetical protein